RKYDAIFAGEHSGHYYFKDNWCADSGLIAAVIALYILSSSGKSLSELAKPHREAYKQLVETNFEVSDKDSVIEKLKTTFSNLKLDELDGLTVYFDGGWFNVRPSNTEPLLRLNVEAITEQLLKDTAEKVTSIINA
ncbi:phosphomannomutase/phosphoglucomutase, partial [Candidatus Saccharibacteria bacterium]|nr:phosphomannomutase/phosphoglucomutase [Candidatus Saccharibacteria bacterium]